MKYILQKHNIEFHNFFMSPCRLVCQEHLKEHKPITCNYSINTCNCVIYLSNAEYYKIQYNDTAWAVQNLQADKYNNKVIAQYIIQNNIGIL